MHRRHLLRTGLGSLAIAALSPSALVFGQAACPARTEPNIEGPFYVPGAPERSALHDTWQHQIALSGRVRDIHCRPMADAVLEVWQANEQGEYDLDGFDYRGVLRTQADGSFHLYTVIPGRYLNGSTYRPAHIHVKVHANGRPPLTTQLYFPGDPENDTDPWFRSSLLVTAHPPGPQGCHPQPRRMSFDFVV